MWLYNANSLQQTAKAGALSCMCTSCRKWSSCQGVLLKCKQESDDWWLFTWHTAEVNHLVNGYLILSDCSFTMVIVRKHKQTIVFVHQKQHSSLVKIKSVIKDLYKRITHIFDTQPQAVTSTQYASQASALVVLMVDVRIFFFSYTSRLQVVESDYSYW